MSWPEAAGSASPGAKAAITGVLTGAVSRGDTPAVVGLVVNREGVLFEDAAGRYELSNESALLPDAIFSIASMTKAVTSVAIMMLFEQGKLSLDDPVSKYIPGFDHLKVITKFDPADGSYETRPAKKTVTLRHLLTHTSGIGYAFTSSIVARLQKDNGKSEWDLPLLHDPGERWTYGASTRVLGLVVERISGETLETFFQERIFKPLGMVDTSFAVPAAKRSRLVAIYHHADGQFQKQLSGFGSDPPLIPSSPFLGDGGLYSTARDYGLFIRMFLNRGTFNRERILRASTIALMCRNQIGAIYVSLQPAAIPELTRPFPLGAGRDKFGLGFQIAEAGNGSGNYRSPGSLSWAGLFNTEFWIDPAQDLGAVLMMQYLPFYDESALRTLRAFETTVYQQLAPQR